MDPDDERRRDARDGGSDDPFDRIVAGWRDEGSVPAWPTREPPSEPGAGAAAPAPAADPVAPTPIGPAVEPDEGHFVPPEPPPLPRIGPPAAVGLVLLALGLVLVWAPGWVGVPEQYGVPLGLLTLASGIGWLVLRLWPTPPVDEDDDGAVV